MASWELAPHPSRASKNVDTIVAREVAHVLADNARTESGVRLPVETSRIIVRRPADEFRANQGQEWIEQQLGRYAWFGRGIETGSIAVDAWQATWAQAFSAHAVGEKELDRKTRSPVKKVLRSMHLE